MRHPLLSLLRVLVLLPSYTLILLIRLLKWSIAPPALLVQLLFGVPLVLNNSSKCMCAWAGVISIVVPGQFQTLIP